jgi:N6-L-threonylcarbamoyladenine synthase
LGASIQGAIVAILVQKVKTAVKQTGLKQVVLGGGVSANSGLRKALENCDVELFLPPLPYTTDNAAMIAMAGYLKYNEGTLDTLSSEPKARMSI